MTHLDCALEVAQSETECVQKKKRKPYYPIPCATAGLSMIASGANPGPGQFNTELIDDAKKNLAGSVCGEESARCIRFTAP